MVLVFNLGGGTCDASLISLDAGILEVPSSALGIPRMLSNALGNKGSNKV